MEMGAGNANGGLRVGLSMGEIVSGASVAAMGVCVCVGGGVHCMMFVLWYLRRQPTLG